MRQSNQDRLDAVAANETSADEERGTAVEEDSRKEKTEKGQ
jgi:hypothetical protein